MGIRSEDPEPLTRVALSRALKGLRGDSVLVPGAIFLALALGVGATSYYEYRTQAEVVRGHAERDIAAIADLKAQQITRWLAERKAHASALMNDRSLGSDVQEFLKQEAAAVGARIRARLEATQMAYGYEAVVLLDHEGHRHLLAGAVESLASRELELAGEALRRKDVVFSELHWDKSAGKRFVSLEIFAPLLVRRATGTTAVGVVYLDADVSKDLYPLIGGGFTPGDSAEVLLIRREGDDIVYLNELRHVPRASLSLRTMMDQTRQVGAQALSKGKGTYYGLDYRGVEVLAAARSVPDTSWMLVARVDAAEVYAPIAAMATRVTAIASALIMIGGVGIGLWWRSQRGRNELEKDRLQIEKHALSVHYAHLTRYANDIILLMDETGRIVDANDRAVEIYTYPRGKLIGMRLEALQAPGADAEGGRDPLQWTRDGRIYETLHCRRDGIVFPVEISARLFEISGKPYRQAIIRDITERKRYESELARHAHYDTLTGLANRNLLQDRMGQAIVHAGRSGRSVGVLLLDLDRLKLINDSLGHGVGDTVLRTAAARIGACVREQDTVARLGGDEFVVVQSSVPDEYAVSDLARRLLDAAAAPMGLGDQEVSITCSIGISMFPKDGAQHDVLLRNADAALHRAKEQGRGRLQFFALEMNARATERLRIQTGLARALERGEFRLHYQPTVDLVTGKVESVEALLRWQTPDGRLLLPAEFIGVAEERGLVSTIGAWVLEQACRQARQWRERYDPELRVTVNVSSVQIRDATLAEAVRGALQSSGLVAEALEIEINESYFLIWSEANRRPLEGLKDLGVRFAIDDFGSHYSGLGFIREFPVDRVKLDQSFVREIANDAGDAAISRALITLAHGLGMKVTAEGVESEAQLNILRRFYCDSAQGSYFCPPAPEQELEQQFSVPARRFSVEPSGRSLLLVDDEVNMLTALKRTLRREGYRILTASSGREALELLASQEVGVILSDQRMPEMTGTELLGRVKLMYPRVVRIVLSGHTDLATITDAINRGSIYKFLTKPWEDDMLRDTLREAFERHERSEV